MIELPGIKDLNFIKFMICIKYLAWINQKLQITKNKTQANSKFLKIQNANYALLCINHFVLLILIFVIYL